VFLSTYVVLRPYCRHVDTGVLSLGTLKRLALSTRVVSSEPRPQPPSAEPARPRAEEELSVAAETRAPITPPPPVPSTAVEEGETATEATVAQVALEAPT
jgi:hypothetical protein